MTMRLLLLEPDTVFTARVDQTSFEYPIAEVDYDNGTEFSDVEADYTVFFGTSAGNDDLGRQRLRSGSTIAASGTLKFGRSSRGVMDGEVALQNDAYITVFELRSVWMKAPFIDDDGTIYKDHDIAYSDQNEDNHPVANAGIGFARSLDGGTSINCDFDGTDSYATADGATISSYSWDVDDGTITVGSTSTSTLTVNFPVGFRYVSLTVTDSNGKTHTTHVPVYCRDPNSDDTLQTFEIEEHRRTAEGQTLAFRVLDDIPSSTYPNGTLVMLWEGEPSSNSDRSHMKFIGWHMTDPAQITAERTGTLKDTTLRCGDRAEMLKRLPGFPVEIIGADSPENWGQMKTPNMDKYLDFLLRWHSTALELGDYTESGTGSDYPFVILGSDGESLWDQVQSKAKALVPDYVLTCNRFGQLQVLPDPMLQDSGDRTSTVQKGLLESDISGLSWEAQNFPRVHWLRGEAILADADTIDAIFCIAPGEAPGQGLSEQPSGEQLAQSQADLNACEGHRYARLNAPNSYFTITLAGGDDFDIDPADMTWVTLRLASNFAAQRGLTLNSERGLPRELNISYEAQRTGTVKTIELIWEQETEGDAAVTEVPPVDDPPPNPDDDPGPWPDSDPDPGPFTGNKEFLAPNTDGYLYYTTTFDVPEAAGGPTWSRTDMSLSGTVHAFRVNPFSPLYVGTGTEVEGFIVTSSNIYEFDFDFDTETLNTSNLHTFGTALGTGGRRAIDASFGAFGGSPPWVMVVSYYADAAGHTGTWSISSQDGGATWASESQITAHYVTGGGEFNPGLHLSSRSAGKAYTAAFTSTAAAPSGDGYVTSDYGANWSALGSPDIQPSQALTSTIYVPWSDNADESLVYHQTLTGGATIEIRTKRVNGASITDISPSDATRSYGPSLRFGAVGYDPDRRHVAVVGVGNDVTNSTSDYYYGAWVSSDYGDSWTQIVAPVIVSSRGPREAAFGASPDILYIWGSEGYISYTQDGGSLVQDKRGNIPDDFAGIERFAGLAGGAE